MKSFLRSIALVLLLSFSLCYTSKAETVTLDKNNLEKPELLTDKKSTSLNGSLLLNDSESLANIIDSQKEHDLKDLEKLWRGTVENNQMIEFALKKLATPESQRRIHSSLMAKTLSAIVSGASFVPSLMVEDLQDILINSYYNYKNTLSQLKITRSKMLLYSKNYNNALHSKDLMELAISTNLYDSMKLQEFNLEQSAKKYHIQIQRLAGKKAVDSLDMYQYDFDSLLYKQQGEKGK